MKAIERLYDFLMYKGMKPTVFERNAGISSGYLSKQYARKADIGESILVQIIENCPEINPSWLLTGRGSMLIEEAKPIEIQPVEPDIQIIHHPKSIEKNIHNQAIKLYDVAAAANLKTLFANKDQNILGEISIPDIPKCDGAIYVRGDSMYPILKSGDIIAYKELNNFQNVIFGEMYLVSFDIEGDDFLTVKYVNHSDQEGYIKLVSYNQHHDPKDIPVSSINAMGLIKFSIRKNTIM